MFMVKDGVFTIKNANILFQWKIYLKLKVFFNRHAHIICIEYSLVVVCFVSVDFVYIKHENRPKID